MLSSSSRRERQRSNGRHPQPPGGHSVRHTTFMNLNPLAEKEKGNGQEMADAFILSQTSTDQLPLQTGFFRLMQPATSTRPNFLRQSESIPLPVDPAIGLPPP